MKASRRQRGFTIVEVAAALVVFTMVTTSFVRALSTTDGLWGESKVAMKAHEELRRNLDTVANTLRGADLDTLVGFDLAGVATSLTFQPVTGVTVLGVPVLGGATELQWRATTARVRDVPEPGEVVVTSAGTTRSLLKNVPKDGFRVTRQGGSLAVALSTYVTDENGRGQTLTGETSVALRN